MALLFKPFRSKLFIALLVGLGFFIIELATLSDYGKNWDETRRYFRSNEYLHFFLSGSKTFADLKVNKQSLYNYTGNFYTFSYFVNNNPIGHPPLSDNLASLFNYIFFEKLGVIGDVESYHLFYILICSILVGYLFYVIYLEYGPIPGVVSALSLCLYPLFFSESHFNFKDPLVASYFGIAVITFYLGITRNSFKQILISSVFAGFGLGTKFNILIIPSLILPWLIFLNWKKIRQLSWPFKKSLTLSFVAYPFIMFLLFYVSWPFLWQNTLKHLEKVFQFYQFWGYGYKFQPESYYFLGFGIYPSEWILFTTPLVILIFVAIGMIYTFRYGFKEKFKFSLLALLWFAIPIIRVTLPGGSVTNGVREIMEFVPGMAAISGIGTYYLLCIFHGKIKKFKSYKTEWLILLSFIPIILKLISMHPNENVYFNPIIGGLQGAKKHNIYFWGNSFGNTYKQAANWLNKNAEPNAKVDLAVSGEMVMPKIWLRKDLKYSNIYRMNYQSKNGDYVVEMTSDWPVWPKFCYLFYAKNFLNPVYEIKVDNVAILTIWKNDLNHTKSGFTANDKLSLLRGCIQRGPNDDSESVPPPFGIPGQM